MRKPLRIAWGLLLAVLVPGWGAASDVPVYRRVGGSGTVRYSNIPPYPSLSLRDTRGANTSGLRPLITSAAHRYGIDPHLVEAVIAVESDFDPWAVSPKGAIGLMQLMPDTAVRYSVDNPFDPLQNMAAGIRYLRDLLDRFNGDLHWALAAYNAGETAVTTHRGIPPFRETREYVKKVLQRYHGATGLMTYRAPSLPLYRLRGPEGRLIYTNIPSRAPF